MEIINILLDILKNYGGEILIAFIAWVLRLVEKPKSNTKAIATFVKWAKDKEGYNISQLWERYKAEKKPARKK